jgi:hypothetical protein
MLVRAHLEHTNILDLCSGPHPLDHELSQCTDVSTGYEGARARPLSRDRPRIDRRFSRTGAHAGQGRGEELYPGV